MFTQVSHVCRHTAAAACRARGVPKDSRRPAVVAGELAARPQAGGGLLARPGMALVAAQCHGRAATPLPAPNHPSNHQHRHRHPPQMFATPKRHHKSKPFFDHVTSFSVADGRIWLRNYQARRRRSRTEVQHACRNNGGEGPGVGHVVNNAGHRFDAAPGAGDAAPAALPLLDKALSGAHRGCYLPSLPPPPLPHPPTPTHPTHIYTHTHAPLPPSRRACRWCPTPTRKRRQQRG